MKKHKHKNNIIMQVSAVYTSQENRVVSNLVDRIRIKYSFLIETATISNTDLADKIVARFDVNDPIINKEVTVLRYF